METINIKNKIRDTIDQLPPEKLRLTLDFLEDLQRSEEDETQTLLNKPGFIEEYRQAKEDISKEQTIPWESIKRDV